MLNRAFLKDYWRKARWLLLRVAIIWVVDLFIHMQQAAEQQKSMALAADERSASMDWLSLYLSHLSADWWSPHLLRTFQIPWLMMTVVMLSILLFEDDRRTWTSDLMFSLPVPRQSLFFTKWIVGVVVITTTTLLFFCVTSTYHYLFSQWTYTSYWVLPQFCIATALAYLLAFTLALLLQTQIGKPVVAGVVAFLSPFGLRTGITLIVNFIWFNIGLPYDHPLIAKLTRLKYLRFSNLYAPNMMVATDPGPVALSYQNWLVNVFVLIVLVWLAYRLGNLAYTKNSAERNGLLIMFDQLIPLIRWGGALGFGSVIAYWLARPALGHNIMRLDLLFVVGTVLSYLILSKALRNTARA
ncbi:MAG: ABC-2 transporter permease [Bacillota bacterium]